jgi:peptidoglycan/xylan/chitin deacetylase (PgdA/CDA1 family)
MLALTPTNLTATTAVGALAATGAVAYAGISPSSQLFGRCLVAARNPLQIALTYDDGPNDAATPHLLEVLARAEVRATFFLIGRFARQRPALVRAIAAAGHWIGSHTETHPALLLCSNRRIRQELRSGNAALEEILGQPVRWFRPPYGARRPYALRQARALGLTPVLWNAMGYDWKPTTPLAVEQNIWRGFLRNQRRGLATNVLLHDGDHTGLGADRSHSVAATAALITRWRNHFSEQGETCEFVTPAAWV